MKSFAKDAIIKESIIVMSAHIAAIVIAS